MSGLITTRSVACWPFLKPYPLPAGLLLGFIDHCLHELLEVSNHTVPHDEARAVNHGDVWNANTVFRWQVDARVALAKIDAEVFRGGLLLLSTTHRADSSDLELSRGSMLLGELFRSDY